MIEVVFHTVGADGEVATVGSIRWDGQQFTTQPGKTIPGCRPSEETLKEILGGRVRGDDGKVIKAIDDPEQWLSGLQREYSGSYSWATAPKRVEGGRP